MGGWTSRIVWAVTALLSTLAAVWLALWYFIPAPPSKITMAVGFKGGGFEHVASRYQERLARHHIKLVMQPGEGSLGNLKLVNDGSAGVDAALVYGGVSDAAQSPDLVSLGRVGFNPILFFYRGTESLDRLSQLKGKRVGASLVFPPIQKILGANGITAENTTLVQRAGMAAADALRNGEVDVIVVFAELSSPLTQSLLRDPNVRVMNLTQAEGLTRVIPFLNRLVLPQGVVDFEKNIPASDVNMIATTTAVVVRKTLHPELIYLLAQTLQEEHAESGILQRAGEFPSLIDPEFPMAEEARDFYKNGPSFLHRYLPFWMVNYIKRIVALLLAGFAVIIPLLTYGPKLYHWLLNSQLKKLYRRLRFIETRLRTELTVPEVAALQSDLEDINRAASIFPMRHSDDFFDLIIHIRLTRAELTSRLSALSGSR